MLPTFLFLALGFTTTAQGSYVTPCTDEETEVK